MGQSRLVEGPGRAAVNIGLELRELRRREAIEADKRDALLARLRWRYGDEEGRRRFAGESVEAARDLDAWRTIVKPVPEDAE